MEHRFEIARTPEGVLNAEVRAGHVLVRKVITERGQEREELVLDIQRDTLRSLAEWADAERVSVTIAGPLAEQVRVLARDMGITPQNSVLLAVNAFIEAGT